MQIAYPDAPIQETALVHQKIIWKYLSVEHVKKCRQRAEYLTSIPLSSEQSEVVSRKDTTRQKHQETAVSECTI